MAEVFFYHLTRSPLEQVLPGLLERVLANNWRALVRGVDQGRMDWLNERLWLGNDASFLPHGMAGQDHDAQQPILLSVEQNNPNQAEVLLLVDGAKVTAAEAENFTRVCLLFDGNNEEALAAARGDWKSLTDAGASAQYWAQDGGSWIKKAEKTAT